MGTIDTGAGSDDRVERAGLFSLAHGVWRHEDGAVEVAAGVRGGECQAARSFAYSDAASVAIRAAAASPAVSREFQSFTPRRFASVSVLSSAG